MLPASQILEQARQARDPRFDGRFFVAVRTTGIYCRPICPVKMPKVENVEFYDSAAAATEAGYRPCLRCRPEASPGTPAWMGTSTTVNRALRLINEGALDEDGSVGNLSERLGVTTRHLTRLFSRHVGASPKTIAQTRRLHFAKKLIDETTLPMTEIAMSAGYGSIRRFNHHFQLTYGKAPLQLRKEHSLNTDRDLVLRIGYREPYRFRDLLDFYRIRATPGVESVTTDEYIRCFEMDGEAGCLAVTEEDGFLACRVTGGSSRSLVKILAGVRRMFDADAIPEEINTALQKDRQLARLVRQAPGLRLPGAFDPFEISVRAVVGQQVSVKGATTVMGRIVERYGRDSRYGRLFPSAAGLTDLDPSSLPMPSRRAQAIRHLARAVEDGIVRFDGVDDEEFHESLVQLPGIGPWTAQYIAMRALGNPDAFLPGDLVIRKAVSSLFGIEDEKALLQRSEAWRPWRGYAGMHLWRYAARILN